MIGLLDPLRDHECPHQVAYERRLAYDPLNHALFSHNESGLFAELYFSRIVLVLCNLKLTRLSLVPPPFQLCGS